MPSSWTAKNVADRRQRLGDRGVDAAVHEAERLAQLVAHLDVRARLLSDMSRSAARRARRSRGCRASGSGRPVRSRRGTILGARMSPLDALAPDQRAVVALVLQQGRSYEDIADMLGIPVAGGAGAGPRGAGRRWRPTARWPDEYRPARRLSARPPVARRRGGDARAARRVRAAALVGAGGGPVARGRRARRPARGAGSSGRGGAGAPAGAATDTRAADEIPGARGADDAPRTPAAGDRAAAAGAAAAAVAAAERRSRRSNPPPRPRRPGRSATCLPSRPHRPRRGSAASC